MSSPRRLTTPLLALLLVACKSGAGDTSDGTLGTGAPSTGTTAACPPGNLTCTGATEPLPTTSGPGPDATSDTTHSDTTHSTTTHSDTTHSTTSGTSAGPETSADATTGSLDACSFKNPDSKLCWQEPPAPDLLRWTDAAAYCDSLNLRLPTVQELASLVRGCPSALCPAHDPDCLALPCRAAPECQGCAESQGPGADGCYWDPALTGPCDWYWTASPVDGGPFDAWFIYFQSGAVDNGAQAIEKQVRCVRTDP